MLKDHLPAPLLSRELHQMRMDAYEEINQERAKQRESFNAKTKEIDVREIELDTLRTDMERKRNRLDAEWREIEEEKKRAHDDAQADLLMDLERSQSARKKLQERLDNAHQELAERERVLVGYEEFQRVLGGRTPEDFVMEYELLTKETRELSRRLKQADTTDYAVEMSGISNERDALREKVRDLQAELNTALGELIATRTGTLDKERLVSENHILKKHKQLLSSHIDDVERRIDSLTKAQQADKVFPQLSRMDEEKSFQTEAITESVPSLDSFVLTLQHRIAGAHDIPLYYHLDDIRLFLGGLAMSQLHILQGMSGTGKTSLVKAFTTAVGGKSSDIAIQAGWRDKYDLVGHYNAFEKKFYEEECLQALYRAQVPQYKDRINIVLLDEMNLSRPEQYFAEFLSALEKNEKRDRVVKLLDSAPAGAPVNLVAGRKILVPENVWFIGTANHDETTNEFADKTRDRSHVMELRQFDPFHFDRPDQKVSYSFNSLQKKFHDAAKAHKEQNLNLLKELMNPKGDLTKILRDIFGIAWGNRFTEHARKFIPVVMAAGGTWELALDHLLATRVFRAGKVTGRYDITQPDLKGVESALLSCWPKESKHSDLPEKCLGLIERDRKRKERGA